MSKPTTIRYIPTAHRPFEVRHGNGLTDNLFGICLVRRQERTRQTAIAHPHCWVVLNRRII